MKQDYVVYKGKTYHTGGKIDILWYTSVYKNAHPYTGIFLDCDEENDENRFIVDDITYCFNKTCFYQTMYDKVPNDTSKQKKKIETKKLTLKDELNIDGLLVAWLWYIFVMAVGTIFNGNIIIWIVASLIFFNYRNKKLKNAGYKK